MRQYALSSRSLCSRQPHFPVLAITTALTLCAVFRLAMRQTEGLIGSTLQLLGFDLSVPDHSALAAGPRRCKVPRPQAGKEPLHPLADSTGLRLCGPGERLTEKHGSRRRRSWKKPHSATDPDTGGSPRRH